MSEKSTESACSSVTAIAEAVIFLSKTGEALLDPTVTLLITRGVCEQENYNESHACSNLSMFKDRENYVQSTSAYYLSLYKLAVYLPIFTLTVYCGAWSDKIGRRTPMIISSTMTIASIVFYFTGRFFIESKRIFLSSIFLAGTLRGVAGKELMQMAAQR